MTRKSSVVVGAFALAVATWGCTRDPLEPTPGSIVRTSRVMYELADTAKTFDATATVTNTLREPLHLEGLDRNLVRIEKLIGGEWTEAYTPIYTLIGAPPIILAPGETREVRFGMELTNRPNTFPRFEPAEISGRYRGVYVFGTERGSFTTFTNEFELHVTPTPTH